jgi:hypothetical protein
VPDKIMKSLFFFYKRQVRPLGLAALNSNDRNIEVEKKQTIAFKNKLTGFEWYWLRDRR